jgi:predicted nuclease of restriction endonuclease-like (RecB) superfamily
MDRPPAKKPEGYKELLADLIADVQSARLRAGVAINQELVELYWSMGQAILERQIKLGWGAKVIDQLSADLRRVFPQIRGLSVRNLRYMRTLAAAWPDRQIVQQLLHNLPWFHHCTLLDKVKEPKQRLWYAQKAIENGWSRRVLVLQIDRELYESQGAAQTNFDVALPAPQSDLAREILKDPYKLDFLGVAEGASERSIELGLVRQIRDFLLELGQGFAFVGNQVPLEVNGEDFRLDLLFYHLKLRCYVVIELKAGAFKPEHAGKLNFYLSAVDDQMRDLADKPSIGLLLCRHKNKVIAEYALRGTRQPMAVSQFELTKALPELLRGRLPSVEDLEAELGATESNETDAQDGGVRSPPVD